MKIGDTVRVKDGHRWAGMTGVVVSLGPGAGRAGDGTGLETVRILTRINRELPLRPRQVEKVG